MAITVVHSAQSAGSANASTVAITSTTAGNVIASFFSQSNANTPVAKVGTTLLTVHATNALFNASAGTIWFAVGTTGGGDTAVTWTPGTSATGHGVAAWELSGASTTHDITPVHTDNVSAATATTPTVTTVTANSIVLIGDGANTSSGTISAWTGTNVATNIGTAAARCFGGHFITTSTISSTFTANWATSRVNGILAVALKPAGGTTFNQALTATSTTTATIQRQINKILTATDAITAIIQRQINKKVTATDLTTALIQRQTNKPLTASGTSTATLNRFISKILVGISPTTAVMTKLIKITKTTGVSSTAILSAVFHAPSTITRAIHRWYNSKPGNY